MNSAALPVRQVSEAFQLTLTTFVNAGLLAAVAALVIYYVFSANGVAASNYHISSLRDDLTVATEQQTELTLQSMELEDMDLVTAFALSHQMVVAHDTSYLFENGNVALVR